MPVRGREKDVADGGSEVEPFDSVAWVADDEGEAFMPPPRSGVVRVALETFDEVANQKRVALEEVSAGNEFNWKGDGNSFCCSPHNVVATGHPEVG